MQLYSLCIEGFRKHYKTEIKFSDSTFLIGENNVGKSSVFAAIEHLLKPGKSSMSTEDFHQCIDDDGDPPPEKYGIKKLVLLPLKHK